MFNHNFFFHQMMTQKNNFSVCVLQKPARHQGTKEEEEEEEVCSSLKIAQRGTRECVLEKHPL